jgi:hypothetical protein
MTSGRRSIPLQVYLFFYALFAAVLFLTHTPFFKLPYFWDEVGLFIPAALDLRNTHALVSHTPGFSANPPGIMAFLAACWSIAGHTIPGTRIAMVLVAAAALLVVFLLAIRLSENLRGAPGFVVVMLMVVSPLFYAQSMLALPDLPAMLFTCLALLLFLQDRPIAAAAACTVLAMVAETGLVVPLVLGGWLFREKRLREAAYFLAPFAAFALWILGVAQAGGRIAGNYPFTRQNLFFLLNPVRFPAALLERLYYLFVAEFRSVGTLAIVTVLLRSKKLFATRDWRIVRTMAGAQILLFSLFGASLLDRYLLPVLPLVYMAMVTGFSAMSRRMRIAGQFTLALGLMACNVLNPPYPQPLENNTAFTAFVQPQRIAAEFLSFNYTGRRILTAWPMGSALSRPDFGYVQHGLNVHEVPDFRESTLKQVDWSKVDVLVLYARHREPEWNLLEIDPVRRFLSRYFGYEPEVTAPLPHTRAFEHVGHWAERGLWVDVYAARDSRELKPFFVIGDSVRK